MNPENQFCANCAHTRVVTKRHRLTKQLFKKIRCVKGHWKNACSEKFASMGVIRFLRPNTGDYMPFRMQGCGAGTCPDYDSMGDGLKEFLEDLPEDNAEVELLTALEEKLSRGLND